MDTVLAAAWAVIKRKGYVRSNEPGATRDVVLMLLNPQGWRDREAVAEYRPFLSDAAHMAGEVRSFILSDAFTGASEYVLNLKTLCASDAVSASHVGLVASAAQAWARHHEREVKREQEAAETVNEVRQPSTRSCRTRVTSQVDGANPVQGQLRTGKDA